MIAMMMDTKKAHQCMRVGYPKQIPRDIPIMIMNIVAYHHSGTSLYLRIILDKFGVSKPEISLQKLPARPMENCNISPPQRRVFGLRNKM